MVKFEDGGKKYFLKSKDKAINGNFDPSLGLQYIKTNEWDLKPERKGPVPDGCNFQHPEGIIVHRREQFSIDGERYPTQNIKGKSLKEALTIYY